MSVVIKRIYEPASEDDGKRILIDRLWPRGVSKEKAGLDLWMKDIAPSPQLRTWFGHKEEKFDTFSQLYRLEMDSDPLKQESIRQLLEMSKEGKVTLLYGAKSPVVNHGAVLEKYLQEEAGK